MTLGEDVNARNKDGETPIFTTVDNDAIPLFIEHGADLSIRNNKGKTVMETAKEKGPFDKELSARQFKVRTSASSRRREIEAPPTVDPLRVDGTVSMEASHYERLVRILSRKPICRPLGSSHLGSIHGYNSHEEGAAKCAV
jgi:hypothetical protein